MSNPLTTHGVLSQETFGVAPAAELVATVRIELESCLRPHSDAEAVAFRESMLTVGFVRDPVVLARIESDCVLLDGHHRVRLAGQLNWHVPWVVEPAVRTFEAAIDWIDLNQQARRNDSAVARKLYMGRRYIEKVEHGGHLTNCAEYLASRSGVAPRTVERAGAFYRAVRGADEVLGDGETVFKALASGSVTATERDFKDLAELSPTSAQAVLRTWVGGEAGASLRDYLTTGADTVSACGSLFTNWSPAGPPPSTSGSDSAVGGSEAPAVAGAQAPRNEAIAPSDTPSVLFRGTPPYSPPAHLHQNAQPPEQVRRGAMQPSASQAHAAHHARRGPEPQVETAASPSDLLDGALSRLTGHLQPEAKTVLAVRLLEWAASFVSPVQVAHGVEVLALATRVARANGGKGNDADPTLLARTVDALGAHLSEREIVAALPPLLDGVIGLVMRTGVLRVPAGSYAGTLASIAQGFRETDRALQERR